MLKRTIWLGVVVVLCCCLGVMAVSATQANKTQLSKNGVTMAKLPVTVSKVAPVQSPMTAKKAAPQSAGPSLGAQGYTAPAAVRSEVTSPDADFVRGQFAKEAYERWQKTGTATLEEKEAMNEFLFSRMAHSTGNSLDNSGGPDAYGYRWIDNQGDSATFSWVELCGDAGATDGPSGDDASMAMPIGWGFPFYGTTYTTVNGQTNGMLEFNSANATYSNSCLPYSNPGPEILPYWDDLYAAGSGGCNSNGTAPWIRFKNDAGNRFIVEWKSVNFCCSANATLTFEVILYPNGKIKFQYNTDWSNTYSPAGATIGIINNTSQYLQYSCNTNSVAGGRAIWFYPSAANAHDYACSAVTSPLPGGYAPNQVIPVTATFTNLGTTTESSPVRYRFNGGATISSATNSLPQFGTQTLTFGTSLTMPASGGPFTLKVWSDLATDQSRINDTVTVVVNLAGQGETCATAIPLVVPSTVTGTTVGYVNDYDYACPYTGSTSPDVVYSYTPSANATLTFNLCAGTTNYDTKMYIYAGTCSGTPVYCNDDFCSSPLFSSYVSQLSCVALTGGTTYYIVIDGYGGASGNYTLVTSVCQPCVVSQQGGDIVEATEPATPDSTNMATDPDGGCNNSSGVPLYGAISCGQTIYGRSFTYVTPSGAQYRDTDWYLFTVAQRETVTVKMVGEFTALCGIVTGVNPCNAPAFLASGTSAYACSLATAQAICVNPGTYAIFAAASVFTGVPVNSHYRLTVTCGVCGAAGQGDICATAFPMVLNTTYTGTTVGYNNDYDYLSSVGAPDVVYSYTSPTTQNVTFSLCGSSFDTYLYIFDTNCTGTPIVYNDDAGTLCASNSLNSIISCQALTAGHTYYVIVDGYSTGSGTYSLLATACAPCDVVHQTGDVLEVTEPWPLPGTFSINDPDGGCNNAAPYLPQFQDITCPVSIFGKTFMYTDSITGGLYRDTDWYRLNVTSTTNLTWSVTGEISMAAIIAKAVIPPCSLLVVTSGVSAGPCSTVTVSWCATPGTWYLWAGGNATVASTAPVDYRGVLTCGACPTGRCCYGPDPNTPLCQDIISPTCDALGGTWTAGMTCSANPCPVHLSCVGQTGTNLLSQVPYNGDEGWSAATSDSNAAFWYYVAERYTVSQSIGQIRFWGLNLLYNAGWTACDEVPMPFVITFYPDAAGVPGTTPACQYVMSLTRVPTTQSYAGFPLWEYDATLSPACTQTNGWIQIVSYGGGTCAFLWANTPAIGGGGMQYNAGWGALGYDLSLCMSTGCETSVLANQVTAYMSPDGVHPWINFNAPVSGQYRIYSTTDKAIDYPNAGWTLEATVTGVPGPVPTNWTDPAAASGIPYKRYVVIHNCP